MIKKLFSIIVILLFFPVSSLAWMVPGMPGSGVASSGGSISYLVDLDFEGTGVAWDDTLGTEVTAGNVDSDGEWCDADSTANHYYAGSQGLFLYGAGASAYVSKNLGGSYTDIIMDFWLRSSDTSNSDIFYFEDAVDYSYLIEFGASHELQIRTGGTLVVSDQIIANNIWTHIRVSIQAETADGNDDGEVKVWMSTSDTDFDGDAADYTSSVVDTNDTATVLVQVQGPYTNDTNAFDNLKIWEIE